MRKTSKKMGDERSIHFALTSCQLTLGHVTLIESRLHSEDFDIIKYIIDYYGAFNLSYRK